jgi:type I restriction enzyme S subunit
MSSDLNTKLATSNSIQEEWNLEKIDNVCELVREPFTPSDDDIRKYVGLEHIEQGTLKLCGIGSSSCVKSNKLQFRSGQILFGKLRPYFRKVIRPDFDGVCSTDILVIDSKKGYDNGYLFYFFANNEMIEEATRSSEGTRMPRASWKYLSQLKKPFPSLPEQRAIAEILSSLDDKIKLNRRMNATLEHIAQAIFKRWFIDFEFPDENGQPYKSSGGEMVESELGEIPRGWEVKELKNFGNIICGKTPSKKIHDYYEDGTISFIKIPDMRNKIFPIDTEDKLSKKGAEAIYKKKVPANSVCVSCIATVGLVCLTNEEAYTNQQINSIIPVSSVSPYYLYFAMKELYEKLHLWASGGSATLNLNTKQFSGIKIVMPPADVMVKFDDQNDSIFKKTLCNSVESKVLSQTRDLLLPRLMSGKIRIPV